MKVDRRLKFYCIALIAAGCFQMAGYVLGNNALIGLGYTYNMSPLPTVFSTVNGVEGFSTKHVLRYQNGEQREVNIPIDQEFYSTFNENFYLLNAYSILFAYPHVFKKEQVEKSFQFLLCNREIFKQFTIDDFIQNPILVTERIRNGQPETIIHNPACD